VSRTGRAVLVVAAEPLCRDGLVTRLREHFAVAAAVGTARAGRQVLAAARPPLAVVVLDPPLPDAPFEEACRLLLAPPAGTAALVLLRRPSPTQVRLACRHGAAGVFGTAIDPAGLRAVLEQLGAGGLAIDPALARHLMRGPPLTEAAPGAAGGLTARQAEALRLVAEGHTSKEIARLLRTTVGAVDHALERAVKRLGAAHRAQAVAVALRAGLL
jgi:DNA-binding NarL/FixJ family response regulator